jgi:hypothetical protein
MKQISDSVDCDKSTYHNYTDIYPIFLEQFRDTEFNLFLYKKISKSFLDIIKLN